MSSDLVDLEIEGIDDRELKQRVLLIAPPVSRLVIVDANMRTRGSETESFGIHAVERMCS